MENSGKMQAVLVLLSLAGVVLALLSTSRYGVGLSPDSVNYISAARTLSSGNGYLEYTGDPFVRWPPLFPTLLAVLALAGIEPLNGARFMNAFVFGLIVFTSGQLFLRSMKSKALAILCSLSILLSVPLLRVSTVAWTESLLALLAVLFVLYIPRFLSKRTLLSLLLVSILAALSCLQRYAGVVLVLTGCILISSSMPKTSLLERVKYIVVFAIISVVPATIWLIRNYILTLTLTGGRSPSPYSLWQNMALTLQVLTRWFVPREIPFSAGLMIVGSVVCAIALIIGSCRYRLKRQVNFDLRQVLPAVLIVLVYTLFLTVSSTIIYFDRISDRFLAPIYVFVMFLVFIEIDLGFSMVSQFLKKKRRGDLLVIGLCSLWLIYPLACVTRSVSAHIQEGAGGYNRIVWRESPVMWWLRTHRVEGKIYSNAPAAIYILAGRSAQMSPRRSTDISLFKESLASEGNNYLVWCTNMHRQYLYDVEELASQVEIEEVATFPDGAIYLLK